MKQEMMRWQWHQLDYMQIICTSLQTDDHAINSSLDFYRSDGLYDTSNHSAILGIVSLDVLRPLLAACPCIFRLANELLLLPTNSVKALKANAPVKPTLLAK